MVKIQKKKQELVEKAFGGKNTQNLKQARIDEIRTLMEIQFYLNFTAVCSFQIIYFIKNSTFFTLLQIVRQGCFTQIHFIYTMSVWLFQQFSLQ